MDAATIFYRIGEFHPTFFPAKSSSSWLRRFAHLAERQLSNNRVVSFLPFFLHSFSPSLLLAASICPIQFTVGFSRGQPRPQPSAAVQRRLRPSKGTATAIRTSGGFGGPRTAVFTRVPRKKVEFYHYTLVLQGFPIILDEQCL